MKETKSLTTEDRKEILYDHYHVGAEKLIVIAHGFFNSKDSVLLKELAGILNTDYDVIVMDFRGHGSSKGVFCWTAKEHIDLIALLNEVHKQYQQIGVVSFSLGASTSIIAATKVDLIDTLICISAASEFNKIDYHFWELNFENDILYNLFGDGRLGKGVRPGPFWLKKEKPVDLAKEVKCPVLFIHGEADWVVKPWHSKKLFQAVKSRKDIALIKNGPHAEYLIRKNKKETVALIKKWLQQTMRREL